MTTVSQRAEQLVLVRDLVVLGIGRHIAAHSELERVAAEERVLVRVHDGRPLERASVYRYFDALRFLGLDASTVGSDEIMWTSSARKLGECGTETYRLQLLTDSEKAIFRDSIFRSDASAQFLSYFCARGQSQVSYHTFATDARSLFVIRESVKRPRGVGRCLEWPAEDNVEISLDPASDIRVRRPRKEFLYTYRYWCLDAGIIDELNVHEAERYRIPKASSYVLFPIDTSVHLDTDAFLEKLYAVLGHQMKQPAVIPVPVLMYLLCPSARISVEDFKSLLVSASRQEGHRLHLERAPGGLIAGRLYALNRRYGERYGNHRYYPVVEGTIRSHLAILPR